MLLLSEVVVEGLPGRLLGLVVSPVLVVGVIAAIVPVVAVVVPAIALVVSVFIIPIVVVVVVVAVVVVVVVVVVVAVVVPIVLGSCSRLLRECGQLWNLGTLGGLLTGEDALSLEGTVPSSPEGTGAGVTSVASLTVRKKSVWKTGKRNQAHFVGFFSPQI